LNAHKERDLNRPGGAGGTAHQAVGHRFHPARAEGGDQLSATNTPFYGSLRGKIDTLSPDALGDSEQRSPVPGAESTWYPRPGAGRPGHAEVRLQAAAGAARHGGPRAEIRVGQRSVLSFMLRPLLRAKEAFTER